MTFSRTTLLCFSPTGTTKTVLTAIAEGSGMPVRLLDMTLPRNRTEKIQFFASEILLIGFPVYAGRLPAIHADIFDLLPHGDISVVPVVVYGNREYDDALIELADLCQAKGYSLSGAAAFLGQHSFDPEMAAGRPDVHDRETARQFGIALHAALRDGKRFDATTIPGNRPYKERSSLPLIPESQPDLCTHCQLCVTQCPMGAIDPETPSLTDKSRCCMCAACISICPEKARTRPLPLVSRMKEMAKNNAIPKQPALFLPN